MTTMNIPIDAAVARLRAAGRVVEKQGMLWRVSAPGAEMAVASADEVRALALTLAEPIEPLSAEQTQWGPQSLPIRVIRRDGGTQARTGLNEDVVQEYAEAMRDERWDWATIKRPLVYSDGTSGDYWLADGFHRIEAAQRAGLTDYRVEVLKGDKRAAQLHAARANADHGLRRSRQDVQRAIELLLRDEEWAKWSDREIARHVHCDHKTVGATRGRLSSTGEIPQLTERQGADGKVRDTTGIAAANTARAVLPPIIPERRATDDRLGERLEQMAAERQAAHAAIPPDIEAAAQNLALTVLARDDRLLLYWPDEDTSQMDPLTPDLAREWLQTEAQGAALYRAEALGWQQRASSDQTRVWYHRVADGRETVAVADALLAAGDALRIAYGEMALTSTPAGPETSESRDADGPWWWASKSVAHPTAHHWHRSPVVSSDYVTACGIASGPLPTTNPNGGRCGVCGTHADRRVTIPARIAVAIRDLAAHGWVVDARAGDQYRLVYGVDAYETGADGVIASALLLAERSYATPDDLMAAVNAIEDAAPAALAPAVRDCECGQPSIAQRNIGGISAWRCGTCASREEEADLWAQLGDQYRGMFDRPELGGMVHRIAWDHHAGGGDYTYDDALSMLHSSAMQLRQLRAVCDRAETLGATIDYQRRRGDGRYPVIPPGGGSENWCDAKELTALCEAWKQASIATPADVRGAAAAWMNRMHTTLRRAPQSTMFRRDEMQDAVQIIAGLLAPGLFTPAATAFTAIAGDHNPEDQPKGEYPFWDNTALALDLLIDSVEGRNRQDAIDHAMNLLSGLVAGRRDDIMKRAWWFFTRLLLGDDGYALDKPEPRQDAAILLRELQPLIGQYQAESLEDLSQAISDLNECLEGTEGAHWLRVGWTLIDLESNGVAA